MVVASTPMSFMLSPVKSTSNGSRSFKVYCFGVEAIVITTESAVILLTVMVCDMRAVLELATFLELLSELSVIRVKCRTVPSDTSELLPVPSSNVVDVSRSVVAAAFAVVLAVVQLSPS